MFRNSTCEIKVWESKTKNATKVKKIQDAVTHQEATYFDETIEKNCNNRRLKGEPRSSCQTKEAVSYSVDNEI